MYTCTRAWAWVPEIGIPNNLPARTLLVASKPPIYAARVPHKAASNSCARREPNSITVWLPTIDLIREAFVAIII